MVTVRALRENSVRLEESSHVEAALESKLVSSARPRLAATPGPVVASERLGAPSLANRWASSTSSDLRRHTLVTHHIVLGCREDAMDLAKLHALGVTHVLNACKQLPNYHAGALVYQKLALLDAPTCAIVKLSCDATTSFLQRVERVGGRCLVHCIAGSSRSVTCILMHLMVAHRVSLHEGFYHIHKMRPQANPNEGFKLQLALLEVELFGGSTVAGKDAGPCWSFYEWNVRKASVNKLPTRPGRASGSVSGACMLQ